MCGIFGYVGTKEAAPILLEGLKTLEYRGYDSAGMFIAPEYIVRAVGPIENLREKVERVKGTTGIAHTRWATHGAPTERNAHPHSDCTHSLWLVHNGIIENYKELRDGLEKKGHKFSSDTDSEVLIHLIESYFKKSKTLELAVTKALRDVRGTYGIAVLHKKTPEKIIVARMGSPIVLGIGDGENFVASDPSPLLRHTRTVLYLDDGEIAVITPKTYSIFTHTHKKKKKALEYIEWELDHVKKDGFSHFMLKEIVSGPEVLHNSVRGRLIPHKGAAKLGGLEKVSERLRAIKRIVIVGCGSAYYAGLTGKYMLEEYAGIPTDVEIGSEFRYRALPLDTNTLVLAISQSGETADTLASIREAKQKGLLTIGIVNVVGSTIARETDAGVYNHAGPEIGVASTKAFLSQLEVLALLTLFLGRQRNLSLKEGQEIVKDILTLPKKVEIILAKREEIKELAERYNSYTNFFYIGRKYSLPISYEGALKLKEVSYIHAEAYGAGEMKHGPIAMISPDFPTVAIVLHDSVYEKTISNIEEIKARSGKIIAVATEGDAAIKSLADDVIYIPKISEMLSPILSVVPLHLFAYYTGVALGHNVDRPRNLAKSVTVE